jgi:hypothetical protein
VGTNGKKKRGTGPTGKMKQLFEAASKLPRSQQQKIAAVLEAFIAHKAVGIKGHLSSCPVRRRRYGVPVVGLPNNVGNVGGIGDQKFVGSSMSLH